MVDIVNAPDEGNASEVTTPHDDEPEKYKGKTRDEIKEMHMNAERMAHQHDEELGVLRKLQDSLMSQPAPASSSEAVSEDVDFYSDPEKAVERLIEKKLAPFQQLTQQQQQEATIQKLNSNYPEWKSTADGHDFQEWIAASKERTRLFMRANEADYDAASELFDLWGSITNKQAEVSHATTKAVERDRKLRAATTEKGSAGIDSRKILSRADLISLKVNNPSRYNDLLPDIRKAYAEGRVK